MWRQVSAAVFCLVLLFGASSVSIASAEIWPVFTPANLTRYSDLIVVAKFNDDHSFDVVEVLKGHTGKMTISVSKLDHFSHPIPLAKDQVERDADRVKFGYEFKLDREVILFLSERGNRERIVYNGLFWTGELIHEKHRATRGVFGFYQPVNPGRYELKPVAQYKNLAEVKAIVHAELKTIPDLQAELLKKVTNAKTSGEFSQALSELNRITRIGDMKVLKQVAAQQLDGKNRRVREISSFITSVGDIEADILLQALHDTHKSVDILYALGQLGNLRSLDYFNSVIEKEYADNPVFPLYGMQYLYLELEERGDKTSCNLVRDSIYRHVDKDLMGFMQGAPQLISVIPEQGSLERLQKAYDHHANRRSNAEHEIIRHIKQCEEKMQTLKKGARK